MYVSADPWLNRDVFMSFSNGVVLRLNLDVLLTAASTAEAEAATDDSSRADAFVATNITLNTRQISRGGKADIDALPPWVSVVARLPSRSRLEGICAFPRTNTASYAEYYPAPNSSFTRGAQADAVDTWNQQ